MIRSRETLASTEAVAMERHLASPFTMTVVVPRPTKSQRPSTSTLSTVTPRPSRARLAARRCASDIPSWSHSCSLACPTAHAAHHPARRSKRCSRRSSVSILESRTPYTRRSAGSTAAPTVSGPAQAPLPTSSIPTTTWWPSAHSARSSDRLGGLPGEPRRRVAVGIGGQRIRPRQRLPGWLAALPPHRPSPVPRRGAPTAASGWSVGLDGGDGGRLVRIRVGVEEGVDDLAGDLLGGEPQAHGQHVGVVPPAGPGGGGSVGAQRRSDPGHLVGGDGDSGARVAADHPGPGPPGGDGLAHRTADLGPGGADRELLHLEAPPAQPVDHQFIP